MSKKQELYLFQHNPPPLNKPQRLRDLFCNREAELSTGVSHLRTLAEDGGEGLIHAIHGDSRVGKSHFVMRLLLELETRAVPCRPFHVGANNLGSARAVLEDLFNQLFRACDDASPDQAPDGQTGILEQYQDQLRDYEPLVNNPSKSYSLKRNRGTQDAAQVGVKLAHAPFEVSLLAGRTETDSQEQGEMQGPISEQELLDIVVYALDVLAWLDPSRKVLLVVDDLDLLDRDGQEGQAQSDRVIDLLRKLAHRTQAIVMATVRQRTMHERDKDFSDFLRLERMEDDLTAAVYRRHVELFNNGEEVFSPDVLRRLVAHARGQIGLFLRRSKELWSYASRRSLLLPLEQAALYAWIKDDIEDLRKDDRTVGYLYPTLEAVRQNRLDIELPAGFEGSRLCNRWLRPLGLGRYEIDTLFVEALRLMLEQPR